MLDVITQKIEYHHGNEKLIGFLAYPAQGEQLPGVLVVHDWAGLNELYQERAIELARLGYVAFSADMYGQGRVGNTNEEKQALMQSIIQDRHFLKERIFIGLEQLKKVQQVDNHRLAAMGFCFGGLCVLDLARMGANLKGVASFHGILNNAPDFYPQSIAAKILLLHAYDDPMVTPNDVLAFCEEMKALKVDFQVNMYANTVHAFTNPSAHDPALGTVYQPDIARRAFAAFHLFLKDIL